MIYISRTVVVESRLLVLFLCRELVRQVFKPPVVCTLYPGFSVWRVFYALVFIPLVAGNHGCRSKMVRMIEVLLHLFCIRPYIVGHTQLGDDSCFSKVHVLCILSAVNAVSGIRMKRPHPVKIQGFARCCLLVRAFSALTVNIRCGVVCVNTGYKPVAFIPAVDPLVMRFKFIYIPAVIAEQSPPVIR